MFLELIKGDRFIPAHRTTLPSVTAVWLLPAISTIVAAGTGALVADILTNPQYALWTLIASYILWGIGMPLSMMVLVVYFQRLVLHKWPPRTAIVSVCVPLGPMGQGSFGYLAVLHA
jgi:tellurite resistance protein TehA-like permease